MKATVTKSIKKALIILLAFTLVFAETACVFAWQEGQHVDIDWLDATEWMDAIPDEAYISALNIPGTHDSGLSRAATGAGAFAQCQRFTIAEQLEAGVRIFDIRLRYGKDEDDFYDEGEIHENYICHGQGIFCCDGYKADGSHYTYEDVLDEMASFIEAHPSEAIFFFVRNEDYDEDDQDIDDCYRATLEENEDALRARFAAEGKEEDFVVFESTKIPSGTMADYRGKILRFPNGKGLGDLMDEGLYNEYDVAYTDKWARIKPYFDSAPAQTFFEPKLTRGNAFRCCYTSCTGQYTYNKQGEKVWNNVGLETLDIFDWFDGLLMDFPTGQDEAEEMNRLLFEYPFRRGAYYGWIGMDMVSADLARLIFRTNDFNQEGMQTPDAQPVYIKDIAGFCDMSYDDAVERCYAAGYTPLPAGINSKGTVIYDINPEGETIVLGYTTTTSPESALRDIVGRYDDNIPGYYEKVIVHNSWYNLFTRMVAGSEDTYLFTLHGGNKAPITGLEICWTDEGVENGMVSEDLSGDKPVGSNITFNLQAGVEDDNDDPIFLGIKMTRAEDYNNYGTFMGSGNILVIAGCVIILVLAVLLMAEKKKNKELKKQLEK